MALLEVRGLRVSFRTGEGVVNAVNDVWLTLERGRTLGLVGESGSGKSVTSMTVLGLTRSPTTEIAGEVLLDGVDLVRLPDAELRSIRGRRVAMVFQDPRSSLHPMRKVGWQLSEAIRAHERVTKKAARTRVDRAAPNRRHPEPRGPRQRISARALAAGCASAS